ncbi:MAG: hypothetical protein GWO08_22590 [Gammaproteobacteria bacterium]|nr:hypothetical protein [Gammaproteobacteria bacterium]NIR96318.1 hypothetical protein [Gammaproteobacteria bacterium]NIW44523.1 hypothetical protein [Gammaproteobacteria bacterium]NIX55647.1 hypothetical protein [candidate division Zixibacteria bacterium]
MTAVRLDENAREFTHASVGNVEVRIAPSGIRKPVAYPGVLGKSAGRSHYRVNSFTWPHEGMLVMYSDGIGRGWNENEGSELYTMPPSLLAHYLLRHYGRENDDATVLVIKEDV